MDFKVQKKDGSLEAFDRNKLTGGIVKAGATQQEAENIAGQIEGWLQSIAGGTVKSVDLRSKVLEILRVMNPTAAAAFESYQKTA